MSMRDCPDGLMRDRLPDLVHGRLDADTRAFVAAHVATCSECASELELLRAIGHAFDVPAPATGRIVAALPHPQPGALGRRRTTQRWLLAAGVSFALLGGVSWGILRDGGSTSVPFGTRQTAARADTLRAAPGAIARPGVALAQGESLSRKRTDNGVTFGGGLADLSDDELQTLLREIESLDATLQAEPESQTTPMVVPREGGYDAW